MQSPNSMKSVLVIYTKYPDPGRVKTRLARDIGDELAASVHQAILLDLVSVHSNQSYDLLLCISPPEDEQRFASLFEDASIIHQSAGDLGQRLRNTTKQLLERYDNVVIIGSDCLAITPDDVKESVKKLTDHDVVLGPADDGGYYLVALKRAHDIFDGIEWSTPQVLAQTMQKISMKKLSSATLGTRYDVDTIAELERLREDITPATPQTFSLLETL